MISYIDSPPTIEPQDGGFLITFKSGETQSQFFLSLHAMSMLCGKGMSRVKEAQAKAALFEPTPIRPKGRRR